MGDTVGTPRKLTLSGQTFRVMGDANFSQILSRWENENLPTSGDNMHKMTRRATNVESITLGTNEEQADALKALSERTEDFTMSYTTANGAVYRASGRIEFESRETESGTSTIQCHPTNDWTLFVAS
jgi:hypothetical protein